jgi:hypothetical protein
MAGLALETARAASVSLPPIGSWWHQVHHLVPIGFVGAISWSVWLVRFTLSRRYRPVPVGYFATTSVIVPAYREDPGIVAECLDSWLAENPTEITGPATGSTSRAKGCRPSCPAITPSPRPGTVSPLFRARRPERCLAFT